MVIAPEKLFHRIHFEPSDTASSSKTPLVFLHGLMGFAANWGKIWPQFYRDRPVLVLDQRGHGKSEKPPGGYSPLEYAEDLSGLLKFVGWEKVHLVGHSMGGRVAMSFAKNFSAQCASLIVEDSGAEAKPDRETWIRNLLGGIPTPFHTRTEVKDFFAIHFAKDPLTGGFLQTNLEAQSDGDINWRFRPEAMIETVMLGRCQNFAADFARLIQPTLILRGEYSMEFPAEEAERMSASRHNTQLVTIPGAGHYIHSEKPAEFSRALQLFLDSLA